MKVKLPFWALAVLLIALVVQACTNVSATEAGGGEPVEKFQLSQVKLKDGPFKHATDLNIKMLLETFEPDRLLARFRIEAGLEPKAEGYDGWESQTIAGHSLGHYLSACALMYRTTGDERFKERAQYIVDELEACQKADPDGYIGAFKDGKKIFTEQIAKGEIRSQGFDLNGIWAPYYTMHKILAGLLDANRLCGVEKGVDVAAKFSDWIYTIVDDLTHDQIQEMLLCEYGGISEPFIELYSLTKNEKYLELTKIFYDDVILDSLAHHKDILPGKHANTQIPKLIALARRYEITGEQSDKEAATFFWDRVVHHHSYVTGGHCNHEYFGEPDKLTNRLSSNTTETCNVYNMLKLSRHLMEWEASAEIGDFYERALFNHILASQHPENGRVIYNLSLEMGGFKEYQNPYWFTCCVGSGMETHSKYGSNIYYHSDASLYVSQFIASELDWTEKGVKVIQETKYPEEQSTKITIETAQPTKFKLNLRYPYWAQKGIEVTVNGKKEKVTQKPGSFVAIDREWKSGDVIEMSLPFSLRLESMPDDEKRIAVMYGPLVLAGDLGEVGDSTIYDYPMFVPVIMTEDKDPSTWLEPTGKPNTFKTVDVGTPRNFELKPFFATHDRRYSVYFDMFNKAEWDQFKADYEAKVAAQKELEAATVDFFQMGEMQPERDHNFDGAKIYVDQMKGKKCRVASRGGEFTFEMEVMPKQSMTLVAEYWGGYTGSKTFDIEVEGAKIATENISDKKPGQFINVHYQIPDSLTEGKSKVKVAFKPHVGHRAGPVFSVRTIK